MSVEYEHTGQDCLHVSDLPGSRGWYKQLGRRYKAIDNLLMTRVYLDRALCKRLGQYEAL